MRKGTNPQSTISTCSVNFAQPNMKSQMSLYQTQQNSTLGPGMAASDLFKTTSFGGMENGPM